MNRIFRLACHVLLALTETPETQHVLRHCLLLLTGVSDVPIQDADFNAVTINRRNERFEEVLRFCRLILSERTPTVQAGRTLSFSLLFDMNKVFERFVTALLCRRVAPRLGDVRVYPQAERHRRHLLRHEGKGVLRLEGPTSSSRARGSGWPIMNTKWKILSPGRRRSGGVSDDDLYQLYAYTHAMTA